MYNQIEDERKEQEVNTRRAKLIFGVCEEKSKVSVLRLIGLRYPCSTKEICFTISLRATKEKAPNKIEKRYVGLIIE